MNPEYTVSKYNHWGSFLWIADSSTEHKWWAVNSELLFGTKYWIWILIVMAMNGEPFMLCLTSFVVFLCFFLTLTAFCTIVLTCIGHFSSRACKKIPSDRWWVWCIPRWNGSTLQLYCLVVFLSYELHVRFLISLYFSLSLFLTVTFFKCEKWIKMNCFYL